MNAPTANGDTSQPPVRAVAGGIVIRIHGHLEPIEAAWRHLENEGLATVYQCFDWCSAWVSRVSAVRGVSVCIAVGENALGQTQFILPLQIRTIVGLRVVEALTAPQGAYGGALLHKDFAANRAEAWFREHFETLLAALPQHDVFRLADVQSTILDVPNPLLTVRHFQSANQSHIMALQPDFEAMLQAKRSAKTRRAMRHRDRLLEGAGHLEFDLPLNPVDRETTLLTMFAHQEQRLEEFGVFNVYDDLEMQFVIDLASIKTSEGQLLRPYRLRLDGETLAVMLGAYRHNTFWALISSLAPGTQRKLSPGDYALRQKLAALCADGTQRLDFSAGDTAYKFHWSDAQVPLNLIVRANSFKGLPLALAMLLREKLKRFAKQTQGLNSLLFALRRKLRGRSTE
jgi:CelD/BcsL family acetyltransferase involved in cellulose biosynthesis